MIYERIQPPPNLEQFIECFWVIENEDVTPVRQKVIPDGFPELIFHYGDPFRILLHKEWEVQSRALIAGQIKKYFYLENTGRTGVIGIKFRPAALTELFGISMDGLTDTVVPLNGLIPAMKELQMAWAADADYGSMIRKATGFLLEQAENKTPNPVITQAVHLIFSTNGAVTVAALTKELYLTERQLERLFKKYIGLSPKFYARVIRFSYIFRLIEQGNLTWAALAYEAGFFDQAHFIKDFRNFTGEDPSQYMFEDQNLANFFMKKK